MKSLDELKNKRILFLSVRTFNLENEIKKKLEEFGAIVDFYDERPNNNKYIKAIIRVRRNLYQKRIDNYYKKILSETVGLDYEFLFINRGEVVPEFFLKEFRKAHAHCLFIYYTWDSFQNNNHPIKLLKHFDKKFTFDSDDAIRYGLEFRPLFFLDSFQNLKSISKNKIQYHLLFVGTSHSDRYLLTNLVVDWCNKRNLKSYTFFYMQGRIVYLYKRIFDKSFKKFDFRKLNFKSLTTAQIKDLYSKSQVLLDINHPDQKGLTMRTFEAIGAEKKMITTNPEIKKYPFYNEKNIYILNRHHNNISLEENFFFSDYQPIDERIYENYSLKGWIKDIFCEKNESCIKNFQQKPLYAKK